jgi:hypothetical protein
MTFVGIDAHPTEHTALAINRFEEEKGQLRFDNTKEGIIAFKEWLATIEVSEKMIIGCGRCTADCRSTYQKTGQIASDYS